MGGLSHSMVSSLLLMPMSHKLNIISIFTGQSCQGDKDAAAVRANYPVPPACGIFYFEVTITNGGPKGCVSPAFSS